MANQLHTMPLKIERLLSSHRVRMLELDEFGAYIKLLCDSWLNGGYLPPHATSNPLALQKLCSCTEEQAERIMQNVVLEFFQQDENGNYYNKCQREIWEDVHAKSLVARVRAEKAAAARWHNPGDASSNAQACQPKPKPKPKNNTPHSPPGGKKKSKYASPEIPEALKSQDGFEYAWHEYLKARKTKATTRAQELIIKTLMERPGDSVSALEQAIIRGWTGLNWDWVDNIKNTPDKRGLAVGQVHHQELKGIDW